MRLALTALAVFSCSFTLMAADSLVGTWKLNVEKSRLHNPVQSSLMKIDLTPPNTYRCVFDSVNGTGEKRHSEVIRIGDGKEHPVEGVNQKAGDTEISSQGLSKVVHKRGGKVVYELETTLSPDGKVHSVTITGTDASGKPYKDLEIFERR